MKLHICAGLIAAAMVAVTQLEINAVGGYSRIDRNVVSVDQPVRLMGVVLRGRFLFLHHKGMMERGKPCTYVYTLDQEREGALVLSFHCQSVIRERATEFKLITRDIPGDIPEVIEVQFAGTTEGHRIPEH
jgi:hypothetical protein